MKQICQSVTGGPDPAGVLQDLDNVSLLLQPGTEIVIPAITSPVASAGLTVNAIVKQLGCTLATLVSANQATASLLTPGFEFTCSGVVVTVAPDGPASDATLNGVTQTFNQNGVPFDVAGVVTANAETPGMFRPRHRSYRPATSSGRGTR